MADFDWVRSRDECSLQKVFLRLLAGVKSDVEARMEIVRAKGGNILFQASNEGNRLLVTRTEGAKVNKIEFALSQGAITVEGDDGMKFRATPGINASGDCTLIVDQGELELWQVRMKALEGLFFNEARATVVTARPKRAYRLDE
jgi:hypothetical protein